MNNHKKVCRVLNYIDLLLIVISTTAWCVPIFAFASLIRIPIGIRSSANRLKFMQICAKTSSRSFEDILQKRLRDIFKTSS